MTPGTMNLYFPTADVAAAHKELSAKGVKVNEVKDDLFGPGSGVKWFNLEDPDGNQVKDESLQYTHDRASIPMLVQHVLSIYSKGVI